MNITLVVNVRGKVCLVHDAPFATTVALVAYDRATRQITLCHVSGDVRRLEMAVQDNFHAYLVRQSSVALVLTHDKEPVEAWETALVFSRELWSFSRPASEDALNLISGRDYSGRAFVVLPFGSAGVQRFKLELDLAAQELHLIGDGTRLMSCTLTELEARHLPLSSAALGLRPGQPEALPMLVPIEVVAASGSGVIEGGAT